MADTQTSDPSLVAPVAVLPIQTVAWAATSLEKCEHEVIENLEASVSHLHEVTQPPHAEDSQQPSRDFSQSLSSDEAKINSLETSPPAVIQHAVDPPYFSANTEITEKPKDNATEPNTEHPSSIPSTVSNSPVQQYAVVTHPLHAPQTKRFTSVNITKRFLEKTSSMSGSSSVTGSLSNTNSALISSSQHRGISPNSRSPSFDRPVSSRLVTAKLTAVPQPSSASTSGWLRPGQTTNSNTTPTPPSTSPQPPLHESTANSYPAIKHRSGTSPAPNGAPVSTGSQSSKPVWAKYTAPSSKPAGRSLPGLDNKSDFPTAAEAVHSMQTQSLRKGKPGKGQTEADTAAAAHKVAQQNAINETAAAFRGTHLDANARWDEMSDEDSEDFDGVIEFGDGTQYKIEQKPNSSQGIPPERSITPFEPDGPPVAKEERFGEDMGRNWPRQSELAVGQPSINKPSLQLSVSSHPTSEALNQTHSPHDGVSPTSRVLFNERLNRLEPLSESKAPFVPRQREPAFTSPTYSSNIQLLQKGLPGTDFKNRGPLRGTGPGAERNHWVDGPPPRGPPSVKNDERSWESRRRESMSSATGSIRDRSRGRDKWVPHHIIGDRDNLQGALAPPTLTRERDGDRPNHLRPPLITPISPRGVERDNFQSNFSAVSPTVSSQSFHSPVLEKSLLAASQPVENSEDVDKNVLLKSAMHLANERARRRKQELNEEERRREEAAERARKKAEALARAMEGKHESQTTSEPSNQLRSDEQTEAKTSTVVSTLSHKVSQEQLTRRLSTDHSSAPPLLLSRKPTMSSVANQAESWRSKAPPKSVGTEVQSTEGKAEARPDSQTASSLLPSSDNPLVPSFPSAPTNELLLKPDEEVEVVDFEDLGKFLGNASPEPRALPKVLSRLSNRPVASDFFQDDFVEHETKTEVLSWRRPTVKAQLTSSVDGLHTQTIPIFSTESSPETELPTMDPKNSQSPLLSPSKRLSQGDHVLNNSQISPVLSALRSPRASHFKEASMSALTDTMSRIKGALDGMQSHDILTAKDKGRQSAPDGWRTLHDGAPQRRSLTPEKLEEFVTCIPPPSSPKPVWKTHTVKIPRVCQIREPLQRKQIHYWNLPYPPFRWDILSWDPPVEGMNKRDLSRDEIFHKKNHLPKGGKLRVVLPPLSSQQAKIFQTSPKNISADSTTLVTSMGIKIKLPSGPSTFRPVSTEHTQDVFNVSSWRGSAIPSISLRTEQSRVIPVISNENLITISRSPPPDPSTPLPQLTPTKKEIPTSFEGPLAANVSLPPTDIKALREPVSFFRTRDVVIREQTASTLLPSFTVNSELDPFTSEPSDQAVKVPITNSSPEPSKTELKSLPSQTFTSTPHELPRLIASKPGSKSSEESATRPGTPPSSTPHTTSPWGKGLAFPVVKDSPTRRVPDPEHLKAVWSQPTSMSTGSTSNSLQDITDEQLPSIPSTVQDMKSEGGETPPPMIAPAPPTRLSQQEVARAFQQVPESPATRAPTYPQNSIFPQYHRPNHSMPLSHPARPSYPPYHSHAVMGHSPSPTLMYATGVDSPVLHPRLPVNGPSPSVANGVWLSTPPLPVTSQHGSYLRPTGPPPQPTQMVYPPSGATPNQMVPHRMAMMGHGSIPGAPPAMQAGSLYAHAQMPDMRNMQNMHMRSPHLAHATPTHPHGVPMQTMHPAMFSPPPPPPPGHAGQPQTMYALPTGANRGTMVPRGYEGYHAMPPHAGYPTTPYMFPS